MDQMDIYIQRGGQNIANRPFVNPVGGNCHEMGNFIHLTDTFMTDDEVAAEFGPRGKVGTYGTV